MICPFRVDVEFEYINLPSKKEDEDPQVLEKAQRQIYAQCMGDECPYYNWDSKCGRIEED